VLGRRFPELETVALRVIGPAEAPEFMAFDPVVNTHFRSSKLREHCVQVDDPEVHHGLLLRPAKIVGTGRKGRPDG
jgi:hypothetical protein